MMCRFPNIQPQHRDQRTAPRLLQIRTIASQTVYNTNTPIKVCTVGVNMYLSLGELHWSVRMVKVYLSLFFLKTVEKLFQKLHLVSVFFLYSFLFDVAKEER